MNKRKKKMKLKIKVIFVFILLVILITSIYLSTTKDKKIKLRKTKRTNDICTNIKYCKNENLDRYKLYKQNNPSLSNEDIVTHINLNLDYSFYTHTKETPLLNKESILVNKYLYLNKNYIPENLEDIPTTYSRNGMKLVKVAKEAFVEMAKAAQESGCPVIAMSSYRSYEYQVNLYNRYAKTDGIEAADTYSARPGFSEHQTGLCIDVYDGKIDYNNFEKSKSFDWMQENAHKYGFILRFPKGKEDITGYQYESWHYRYVGKSIAKYIHKTGITFDEYYARFIDK